MKTARYFLPPFSLSSVSSVWKLWNLASASLPVSKARLLSVSHLLRILK